MERALSSPSESSLRPGVCATVEAVLLLSIAVLSALGVVHDASAFDQTLLFPKAVVIALVIQLCLYYNDLYEDFGWHGRVAIFMRVGQSVSVAAVVLALIFYAFPPLDPGRRIAGLDLVLAFVVLVAWRTLFVWGAGHDALRECILILGTGQSAQHVARETMRRSSLGFKVVGFVGETEAEVGRRLVGPSILGTTADLRRLVEAHGVDLIIVAVDDRRGRLPVADLLQCRLDGVRVEEASSFHERIAGTLLLQNLRPSWLIFAHGFNRPRFVRNTKRVGDVVGALALLILLAPFLTLVAALVKLTSRGPVFFRQVRVGENGRTFSVIKFRSMPERAESATGPVWTEEADSRLTSVGRFLRRYRVDELPQLLNVVSGEMSFVGPRPERPYFVEMLRPVIPFYDERHNVKPGITGWAQIKFGYGSTIEDTERKLQFDLYYVKNMSFFLDVAIVLDTFKVLLPGWRERSVARR